MFANRVFLACSFLSLTSVFTLPLIAQDDLSARVREAMSRAIEYYSQTVAQQGGYAYYYSADLKTVWGENKVDRETILVQPPGTPTVGMAYLKAYEATKDQHALKAAKAAAHALLAGQLQSGGWTQTVTFTKNQWSAKYRKKPLGNRNTSSLDDDQTQSALRFLMRCDQTLHQSDAEIHESVMYGLNALLKAQFANGAFPQVWTGPVESHPVVGAKYPLGDWKSEGRIKNYWDHYTLNDGLAGTVAETLIEAHQIYGEDRFIKALRRLGDFLILAQMPEPQPAWCQQYNTEMEPIWARKFEPPAITGWESQDAMRTLIRIAQYTKDKKYLQPIPKALKYLKPLVLADGRVARYYELKTNRPLYMTSDYSLTYDDRMAPSHYGWKQPQAFDEIERTYEAMMQDRWKPLTVAPASDLRASVRSLIEQLDREGRWITIHQGEKLVGQPGIPMGTPYLSSQVFSDNISTLAAFLKD